MIMKEIAKFIQIITLKTQLIQVTGLPGGYRYYLGIFANLGSNGNWWSASELNISNAYYLYLLSNSSKGYFHHDEKRNGFSLRCVRD
jgi:uncharacterized protein (TIGR02145 family)